MPFLIADASAHQGPNPNWAALAADPRMMGIILKATEGTHYAPSWFVTHWKAVRSFRRGVFSLPWFRGAYHFLRLDREGAAQADFYLAHVERAGGWAHDDIMPIVDLELGGSNAGLNHDPGHVIATTSAFARRVKAKTGRPVMLYGRGAMRDLAIDTRMDCDAIWNPGYTGSTMPLNGLTPAWSRDDVVLWQYTDGGSAPPAGLPQSISGFVGGLDLSVYVDGARKPTYARLRARLLGRALDPVTVAMLVGLAVAGHFVGGAA